MSLTALKTYLSRQPSGPPANEEQLEELLVSAWDELEGSGDGGMESRKLRGRMERLSWSPPTLSFQIERHGATVNSSVYAEVQLWEVDFEKAIARYDQHRSHRRQVAPKDRPLKVGAMAKEIAGLIKSGLADHRLKWLSPTEAKVLITDVIPGGGPQQTVSGRRKRFYVALQRELADTYWTKRANSPVFEAKPQTPKIGD